ncbi:MAG: cache domain-containing protein [Sulfurospirillaceae bacterium]|nr:cache domain-containing protein [Sulfurospirillaceae bacterium]
MKKRLSLFDYFHIVSYTVLISFLIIIIVFIFYEAKIKFEEESTKIHNNQMNDKKNMLQNEVKNFVDYIYIKQKKIDQQTRKTVKTRTLEAYNIAMNLYNIYKDKIGNTQIKQMITNVLRGLRYENNEGYYFITKLDGINILFPSNPEMEGKNMFTLDNKRESNTLQRILNIAKYKNEGFIEYEWSKPNQGNKYFKKVSYVKLFKPYNWVIGTGLYFDDMEAKAQKEILDNKNRLRHGNNYIFVGTWDGLALTYPSKNQNMYNIVDKNGKYIVRELIEKAKSGGGFVEYTMPALNKERNIKKLSYVVGIPKWHWYVGSGVYLDDIYGEIEWLRNDIQKKLNQQIIYMLFMVLGAIVVFAIFYVVINKKIKNDFLVFANFFDTLSHKDSFIDIKALRFSEFKDLAMHANKMLESKLAITRNLEQYKKIVSNSDDLLSLIDRNYVYLAISGGFIKFFHKKEDEILGHSMPELLGKEYFDKNLRPYCDKALSGISFEREYWIESKYEKRYLHAKYFPYFEKNDDKEASAYVVSARDITDKKNYEDRLIASERELEYLAHNDILTGLPNRIFLLDRINHAIDNCNRFGTQLAVCYIDLDDFKKINDSFGHSYGDEVLKQFSQRMLNKMRKIDTLSRIGGDEFILLIENLESLFEVPVIIQKIHSIFLEPFVYRKSTFFLTCSIGISFYPDHGEMSEVLIKNADIAMYRAKNSGKSTYAFFEHEMSIASIERIDMENALRNAIKKEQFVVYYQPQVDLKTLEITGLEALLRWDHPEEGILTPTRFIGICEDTRLIIDIGAFVLKQSCEDLIKLKEEGLLKEEATISVNASGVQIEYSDFLNTVKNVIEETSINPAFLEIEITESFIMQDPQRWIKLLTSLRDIKVKIAIDDFGTGYSSLSYLLKLPIDKLKVDIAFVNNIPNHEDACAIVCSILDLAQNMKILSLAEGIETKEQKVYLEQHGCDQGQGYFFTKPLSLSNLMQWLKSNI